MRTNASAPLDYTQCTDRGSRIDVSLRIDDGARVDTRRAIPISMFAPQLRKSREVEVGIVGNDASATRPRPHFGGNRHDDAPSPSVRQTSPIARMAQKCDLGRTSRLKRRDAVDFEIRVAMQFTSQRTDNEPKTQRPASPGARRHRITWQEAQRSAP